MAIKINTNYSNEIKVLSKNFSSTSFNADKLISVMHLRILRLV